MHPALHAVRKTPRPTRTAGKHRRLVPALHAAGRVRRARRLAARHRRLRASLRRRGGAGRRSCRRLERAGFAYRIAIAGTIGAAWAAAHYGEPASYRVGDGARIARRRCRWPRCGSRREPSRRWRASASNASATSSICRARRWPPASARDLLRQLDRALGREHEPLNPRLPVAPYVAEQRFAEPIAREEDVLGIVERLAARLQVRAGAARRRRPPARTHFIPHRRRSAPHRRRHIAAVARSGQIRALFVERLAALADEFDPGFGFDMARLSVVVAEPCPPEQIGIGGGEDAAEVDRLVDRLSARWARTACAG